MATTTLAGTTGNDILNAPGSVTTLVAGYQGNDTITLVKADDVARGGAGSDSITLNSTSPLNTVYGGEGNDSLYLVTAAASFNGSVNLGGGSDQFVNSAVQVIGGSIGTNAGADTIRLLNGVLNAYVGGGADNDSIAISGAQTNVTATGGKGADTIIIGAGTASLSTISGGDGHDRMLLTAAAGSNSYVATGGKGADSIRLGSALFASIAGGGLADTINFLDADFGGGKIYLDGIGVTTAGTGTGGAADGNDLVMATKTTFGVATSIYGGGGADTIKLSGNFSDAGLGHLIDGGDGADLIGKSTVDFVNAASGVSILGGAGNDTIKLERGATKLYINGGAGADSIFAATGIDSFSVLGGNGADTMTLVDNGYAKTSAGAYFDGGSGVDVFNQNAFLTAIAITSVLTKQSLANIAYGSGDIINLTTAGGSKVIAAGFTTINLGQSVPHIYITSTLTALQGVAKGSGATKASGLFGTTKAGTVAVWDSDGYGATDGDLVIAINNDATGVSKWSLMRIVGGDELLTTTKVGKQALSTVNITFSSSSTGLDLTMTLG